MSYEISPVEIPHEGSYISGLIGALLGALVGAVVWALVMQLGIIAGLVGFVIGFLAEKGYNLLKGKQGSGKVFVLVIAIIFGVLAGTFLGQYIDWCREIAEYAPVVFSEVLTMIYDELHTNNEYLGAVIRDLILGLGFGIWGALDLLKSVKKNTSNQ